MKSKTEEEIPKENLWDWRTPEVITSRQRRETDKQAISIVGEAAVEKARKALVYSGEQLTATVVQQKFFKTATEADVKQAEKDRNAKVVEDEQAKRLLVELKEKSKQTDIAHTLLKNQLKDQVANTYREAIADDLEEIQELKIKLKVKEVIAKCLHMTVSKLFPDTFAANLNLSKAKLKENFPILPGAGLSADLYRRLGAPSGTAFAGEMEALTKELENLGRKPKDWRQATIKELNAALTPELEFIREEAERMLCIDQNSLDHAAKLEKTLITCQCGKQFKGPAAQMKFYGHAKNVHYMTLPKNDGFRSVEQAEQAIDEQSKEILRERKKRGAWIGDTVQQR